MTDACVKPIACRLTLLGSTPVAYVMAFQAT